jgi:hypothetical protein
MSEAVKEKATDEVKRHCGLLVEGLEVARCEQTSILAEAEKRLWHDLEKLRSEGGGRA